VYLYHVMKQSLHDFTEFNTFFGMNDLIFQLSLVECNLYLTVLLRSIRPIFAAMT
jgi:hypothetical protein